MSVNSNVYELKRASNPQRRKPCISWTSGGKRWRIVH